MNCEGKVDAADVNVSPRQPAAVSLKTTFVSHAIMEQGVRKESIRAIIVTYIVHLLSLDLAHYASLASPAALKI